MHRSKVSGDYYGMGTLWSVMVDLTDMRVFRAEGHPCSIQYEEDGRLGSSASA